MHSAAPPLRFYRGDLAAAAGALALTALCVGLTLLDVYGDWIMKRALRLAALVAVAFVVTACVGGPRDLKAADAAATAAAEAPDAETARIRLEALKEVNRHIETCDRHYALPLSITITCKAQQLPTAEQLAALLAGAFAQALKAADQLPPPDSPK